MNESIKKTSRGFYIALFIGVVFVVLAASLFPQRQPDGRFAHSMSNLKQIGWSLHLYAKDNDGRMPLLLSALTPEFLEADSLPKLRFQDLDGKTGLDWLYYPKADFNALPDVTILAASPRTMRLAGKEKRMVLHGDTSVTTMLEPDFQKQLAEELRVAAP